MITSVSNPKIKHILHVRDSAKARRQEDCFFVEGARLFFEAPAGRILEAYVTEEFEKRQGDRLGGYRYERISETVCRHLSDTETPQGVCALVRKQEVPLRDLLSREAAPCIFLLENLQDPGNMGSIFRTAEAAGVTGIVMNRDCVDPYNPKVVRATMGAIYRLPFAVAKDFTEILSLLRERGVRTFAAHLGGTDLYEEDFRGGTAFFIGNEGAGLSEELTREADGKIRIPMEGQTESLNAAAAAAVIMYEVLRQRRTISIKPFPKSDENLTK